MAMNHHTKKSLDCRMYRNEYPEKDELVVVQVKSIAEHGAYCALLEYNKIEGMILMSELSRRRIRSVNRLIRVGKQEIVQVMRVNKEKGYIDLSKKRVSREEVARVEARWNKSKAVHSIMRHVARGSRYGVEELYRRFGWPMARKYGHAYDAMKKAQEHREEICREFDIPGDIREDFFKIIANRMRKQVTHIRCGVEVTCFKPRGILAIKEALQRGLNEHSTDDQVIKITLQRPPLYHVSLSTIDPEKGKLKILEVVNTIRESIASSQGNAMIKEPPAEVNAERREDTSSETLG